MIELTFDKTDSEYNIEIQIPNKDDTITMSLDTGSPISIICIQYLVQITREPMAVLLKKIDNAINNGCCISYGVYGSQEHKIERRFVPYLLKDVTIGGKTIKYFLIWVDVTNWKKKSEITSTLFGFDNIKVGKKWFDEDDRFHIQVESHFNLDIGGLRGVLTNFKNTIATLSEIRELGIVDEMRRDAT